MTSSVADNADNTYVRDTDFRVQLARQLTTYSILAVAMISGLIVIGAILGLFWERSKEGSERFFEIAKYILSVMLPVVSAWVGTVLAYYFSRENYEAATRSTAALVKQLTSEEKLKSIIAKSVMIPIEKAAKLTLDKKEAEIKLKADIIDAILDKENRNRLPMLDTQGRAKYIAHRSTINEFIIFEGSSGKKLDELTLEDMLKNEKFSKVIRSGFGTISETASLAEAKVIIDKIDICLDVFVTEDGTPNTKVLGWLTNAIVMENSKV